VQFLALESDRNYGHVGSVAILDPSTAPGGAVTVEDMRRLLSERLHLIPPFTSRLAEVPLGLDLPFWVRDDHFDIGYHCREIALPPPGSPAQLAEQVARIYSRRLDRSRPLWELYLIHGLAQGRVALLTKVHHAAVDGMSGGEILTLLYDVTPEPRPVDPPPGDGEHESPPGGAEMLARGLVALPRYPATVASRLSRLLPHIDVVPSLLGMPGTPTVSRALSRARRFVTREEESPIIERPAIRAPRGPYGAKLSPHRIFGFASASLSDVKRVKDHHGVKVNDVVVALVAGAVREHLITHDQLPDGPLVTQIPVSVRTEEERGTFGNQVSIMSVPVPTHIDVPAERLAFAHDVLSSAKDRHNALPAKALRDVTAFIPPALHTRAARVLAQISTVPSVRPLFNLIISNVPGPPMDIYTGGARLEALFPLSIIADGTGLNVTVMSYRDSVDIGITADREQTPDVQTIADGIVRELAVLVATLPAKVRPAARRAAAR